MIADQHAESFQDRWVLGTRIGPGATRENPCLCRLVRTRRLQASQRFARTAGGRCGLERSGNASSLEFANLRWPWTLWRRRILVSFASMRAGRGSCVRELTRPPGGPGRPIYNTLTATPGRVGFSSLTWSELKKDPRRRSTFAIAFERSIPSAILWRLNG